MTAYPQPKAAAGVSADKPLPDGSPVQLMAPELVLQQARDLHKYYTNSNENKPYTAGVIADCINAIEALQEQLTRLPAAGVSKDTRMSKLDQVWEEINALGGSSEQNNSYDQGIVDTVAKALEIVEKAQASAPVMSTAKEMLELLGCPFCGKPPKYDRRNSFHEIRCPRRGCVIAEVTEDSFEEAAKRWNTRTLPSSDQCVAREALPTTNNPVAWILPGEDTASESGWLDARIDEWGEFTRPLYGSPPLPTTNAGGANAGVVREALTLGRDAVMESFDYVSDKADQDIADMRLRSIDAALALTNPAPTELEGK